jgi:hypothetical protein
MEEALENDPTATMNPMLEAYQPEKDDLPPLLYMRRAAFRTPLVRKPEKKKEGDEEDSDEEDDLESPDQQSPSTTPARSKPSGTSEHQPQRLNLRPPDILNRWGRRDQDKRGSSDVDAVGPGSSAPRQLDSPPPTQITAGKSAHPPSRPPSTSRSRTPIVDVVNTTPTPQRQPILSGLRNKSGARRSSSNPRTSNAFDSRPFSSLPSIDEFDQDPTAFDEPSGSTATKPRDRQDKDSSPDDYPPSSPDVSDLLDLCKFSERFHRILFQYCRQHPNSIRAATPPRCVCYLPASIVFHSLISYL